MRLDHVQHHVEQQLRLGDRISNSFNNLITHGLNDITSQKVQECLTLLKDNWERFSIVHKAITLAVAELTDEDQVVIRNHSYFLDDFYVLTREHYLQACTKLNALVEQNQEVISVSTPRTVLLSSNDASTCFHHVRLPRIEIPKFDGTPSNWLSFKDLFSSLVIDNVSLTPVEKLQYLKTNLVGSAALLLKNTTLTANNFTKSWEALIVFFENKRLLVNVSLNSLFSIKRMTKESAVELEKLYTNVLDICRSLEALQCPITYWDDVLIFTIAQRLDSETVKEWEQHLGASTELPTWKQFNEFIVSRLRSLQAFEKSRSGKNVSQQQQGSIKSHFHGQNNSNTDKPSASCHICKQNHFVMNCSQYTNRTVQQKLALIRKHKLCYNCLGLHQSQHCKSLKRCQRCAKKHHTTIHQSHQSGNRKTYKEGSTKTSEPAASKPEQLTKQVLHSTKDLGATSVGVLLATALVNIISPTGDHSTARALVDQGSEISLVTERLVQRLQLERTTSTVPLIGIGGQKSINTRGLTSFTLKPHYASAFECTVSAHILPRLTTSLPSVNIEQPVWSHLNGLKLADPHYLTPGSIDIIIGADVYGQLICDGVIKGSADSPIAQHTQLGWIVSGPTTSRVFLHGAHGFHVSIDDDIYKLLHKFWELEEPPSVRASPLSALEQACENHFQASHSRDEGGRYIVQLPFKDSIDKLGDSRRRATLIIHRLFNKLKRDAEYSQHYSNFISEYAKLQHMRLIPDESTEPSHAYYLPHHGVWKANSLTTKLRVVFNGSSPTTSGFSLNDLLHTGQKLQTELFDVLIRFRLFRYAFSSDIEKMFRQIHVHPDHWKYQRILWTDQDSTLRTYELTTVTYGLACAPFLALRVLSQLVTDEGSKFPLAVSPLTHGRYVDDVFGGADTIERAQDIVSQLRLLCTAGGFKLQKWTSNNSAVLKFIPEEEQICSKSIPIEDNLIVHALGLCWQPASDLFQFTLNVPSTEVITKRRILSTIAKLFDPLGLLSPITITAKILIQELWTLKLDWDDPLPNNVSTQWINFLDNLRNTANITFPRWLGYYTDDQIEIHGFCDASQQAISAATYMRIINQNGEVTTTLLASKTKVAPLKRLTIPRLELSGAFLLTKLTAHLVNVLKIKNSPVILWTDSSITHTWIVNHPSRWKEFVSNRVSYIQETLPQAVWKFVPGSDNPADLATRGLTPTQLSTHQEWWTGPQWLSQPSTAWPTETFSTPSTVNLEERPVQVHITVSSSRLWDLLRKYSNLTRLIRITAWCKRAIVSFRGDRTTLSSPSLSTIELENARIFWVKTVQKASFRKEIELLSKGLPLPTSNSLVRLTPFIDSNGLLRLGGRLQHSLLPSSAKHPLILPKDSPLTLLIIAEAHNQTLHGGTQLTLSFVRNEYWIIGGRATVRSQILNCVRCARYRQKRAQQLMGQLPTERATPNRPFAHSGVDYAGPFTVKTWRGKNAKTYKAYIALFVCFSTSAVHLELVTDYSTDAFIAAYKRFTARRGICSTLTSDCGTNFKGSDVELRKLFASQSQESEKLTTLLANDGTEWKFNPPSAPHFGGKWEAGVKSVKFHLRRVVGDTSLTYEEFNTLLTQIEAVLNSRPLSPLTEDPDDLDVLTPSHFLMGCQSAIIPEPSMTHIPTSRLSRWQLLRQLLSNFWTKWSKECLQRYYAMYKWNRAIPSLEPGTLVLVTDERYPPSKWPLGRVLETHPGADGLTRVVTVRTQTTTLKRPIVKICPLPVSADTL